MELTTALVLIVLIICITVIICFCLCKNIISVRRLFKLVSRLRIENRLLKKEVNDSYDEWLKDMIRHEKSLDELFAYANEIIEKLNEKNK